MLANLIEGGNAIWAILAFYLTIFMIYHLVVVRVQRRIPWRALFFNFGLPMSIQLAVGIMVMGLSILLTQATLWWGLQGWLYFIGIATGVVGFLCILRTIAYPTLGHWPWVGALITSVLYLFWWGFRFI